MYWIRINIRMFILHYIITEYDGNLCSPCPLHEQPKRLIYIFLGSANTITCVPNSFSIIEESILLVTLVHVLSLTVNIYDKSK